MAPSAIRYKEPIAYIMSTKVAAPAEIANKGCIAHPVTVTKARRLRANAAREPRLVAACSLQLRGTRMLPQELSL